MPGVGAQETEQNNYELLQKCKYRSRQRTVRYVVGGDIYIYIYIYINSLQEFKISFNCFSCSLWVEGGNNGKIS